MSKFKLMVHKKGRLTSRHSSAGKDVVLSVHPTFDSAYESWEAVTQRRQYENFPYIMKDDVIVYDGNGDAVRCQ